MRTRTPALAIWLRAAALVLLWLGCAIAVDPLAAAAQAAAVQVDRLDRGNLATPAADVVSGAFDAQFKPQPYVAITPAPDRAVWYRLALAQDWSAQRSPVLSIADPQGLEAEVYLPPAYVGVPYSIYRDQLESGFSRRSLTMWLPATLKAHTPIYLRIAPARPLPHDMKIESAAAAGMADLDHARLDVLFPAIQLASLLVILAFFMVLREGMYGYFVGHVMFLVLYEVYEFGIGYEFAPFNILAPLKERPTWLLAAIAAVFLCQFSRRFLDLRVGAPRIDRLLGVVAWLLALLGACAMLPSLPVLSQMGWIIDALLFMFLILAALLLVAAVLTWHQGSRSGGLFLFAWLPGLLCVIVRVLQLMAHWPQPGWLELALPAAFAFASMVLAFGLAEQTLAVRHERDVAHRLAEHDMLTGALNRRAIQTTARAAFRNAREAGESLALLFLDLDHFKNVNDSYGHRAGDRCLRAVATPIAGELRHGDSLGRYGGEEFLVVLPQTTASQAKVIAERIRNRVQEVPVHVSGTSIGLTLSVGIAVITDDVDTVEDLIEYADAALYRAKSSGRNTVSTHPGPGDSLRYPVQSPTLPGAGTDDTPSQ